MFRSGHLRKDARPVVLRRRPPPARHSGWRRKTTVWCFPTAAGRKNAINTGLEMSGFLKRRENIYALRCCGPHRVAVFSGHQRGPYSLEEARPGPCPRETRCGGLPIGQLWRHLFRRQRVADVLSGHAEYFSPPDRVPSFPYLTLKAISRSPLGPWQKQPDIVPFRPQPGTYYSTTASPGFVVKDGGEFLQFFSASVEEGGESKRIRRTIGIARTKDLEGRWVVDPEPIVPLDEQIENTLCTTRKKTRLGFCLPTTSESRRGMSTRTPCGSIGPRT